MARSIYDAPVVSEIREKMNARATPYDREVATEDVLINADVQIPVRIFRPRGADRCGTLVYFHGGGWVAGTETSDHVRCQTLVRLAGCNIVSVGYRLAPENKFPSALDDCVAAVRWVLNSQESLGFNASRIALGGVSAGGNLAAAACLMLKDEIGAALRYQFLTVPVLDAEFSRVSYLKQQGDLGAAGRMAWYWDQYVPNLRDRSDPRAAPLRAVNLEGLPPTLIQTAGFDPLRDEGLIYAGRLAEAGIEVDYTNYPRMLHGFLTEALPEADLALSQLANGLRRYLANS